MKCLLSGINFRFYFGAIYLWLKKYHFMKEIV